MIDEHDRVVLRRDLSDRELQAGDVGTVVHVHQKGEAYEVEFVTLTGDTVDVVTLEADAVRPVRATELTHARGLE